MTSILGPTRQLVNSTEWLGVCDKCAAFGQFRNEGPHQSWRQRSSRASRSFQHSSRSFILHVSTLPELYYAKEMRSGYFYFMVCQLEKNRLIAFICTHPHTYIQLVFADTVHLRSSPQLHWGKTTFSLLFWCRIIHVSVFVLYHQLLWIL